MSTTPLAAPQSIGPEDLIDLAAAAELQSILKSPLSNGDVNAFRESIEKRVYPHFSFSDPPKPAELRYQLLRFLIDDDRNRLKLQALQDQWPTFDRGDAVLKLWQVLAEIDRKHVQDEHHSIVYHQRRLFEWFIDQYDLVRARRVYTGRAWLASGLQFVPAMAVGLAFLLVETPAIALLLILAGYVLPALLWSAHRLAPLDFIQSLIPRLAGTAAAGAALMLSSEKLMGFLRTEKSEKVLPALLVPAVLYLVLEIQHRVRPRLRWRQLTNRVANVVFLALPHAAAIVFFVLPVIRHSLEIKGLPAGEILRFTTAVFTAGLVLNVIWAEEPVTRPL